MFVLSLCFLDQVEMFNIGEKSNVNNFMFCMECKWCAIKEC